MADEYQVNFAQVYPQDEGKLGEFLKRSGRPLLSRIDIRLTSQEELKWAATIISQLNAELQHLAYASDADNTLKILLARQACTAAAFKLRYIQRVSDGKKKNRKAPAKAKAPRQVATRDSVPASPGVGKLNKPRS
jgi:hypothetical protein